MSAVVQATERGDARVIFAEPGCHPEVLDSEYKRLLRYPPEEPWTEATLERAQWARGWFAAHARPWWFARRAAVVSSGSDTVEIDGDGFHCRPLAARLRRAGAAVLVVASAGSEVMEEAQRLWSAEEPDRYYFLECFASAAVEALITEARARLCVWADARDEVLLAHYSPGYPGWDVGQHVRLLETFRARGAISLPGPLDVLPSGMPSPRASQLAVFGLTTPNDPAAGTADARVPPCRHCTWLRCDVRREPYVKPESSQ